MQRLYGLAVDVGDRVHVRFTKWGGIGQWEMEALVLGRDDAGVWLGLPKGAPMRRPGREVRLPYDRVMMMPEGESGFVASFHEWIDSPDVAEFCMYVDITTPPRWTTRNDGVNEVTMVDLDLDVVQAWTGEVSVQDEDDFAERQISLGYPPEVIAHAERWRDRVVRMHEEGAAPFDGREGGWLDVLATMADPRDRP